MRHASRRPLIYFFLLFISLSGSPSPARVSDATRAVSHVDPQFVRMLAIRPAHLETWSPLLNPRNPLHVVQAGLVDQRYSGVGGAIKRAMDLPWLMTAYLAAPEGNWLGSLVNGEIVTDFRVHTRRVREGGRLDPGDNLVPVAALGQKLETFYDVLSPDDRDAATEAIASAIPFNSPTQDQLEQRVDLLLRAQYQLQRAVDSARRRMSRDRLGNMAGRPYSFAGMR